MDPDIPVGTDTEDPNKKASDKILTQLGLHPAQQSAQQDVFTRMLQKSLSNGGAQAPPTDTTQSAPPLVQSPEAPNTPQTEQAKPAPVVDSSSQQEIATNDQQPSSSLPSFSNARPTFGNSPSIGSTQPSPISISGPSRSSRPSILPQVQKDTGDAQTEYDRLIHSPIGIDQIHNPVLRTLAHIGDVAGEAIAPGLERLLPGTQGHHDDLVNQQVGRVNRGQAQEGLIDTQGLHDAQTTEALNRGEAALHPKLTPDQQYVQDYLKDPKNAGKTAVDADTALEQMKGQAKTPTAQNTPLKNVAQVNQGLADVYGALHKGQKPPPEYQLGEGATEADYKRVDTLLEHEGKIADNETQRQQINAMREQTHQLAVNSQADREANQGRKLVVGTDSSGRQVAVPASQAKSMGLQNPFDLGSNETDKVLNARNTLYLFNNNEAEDPGLIQLANKMQKDGKLGVIASRWNDFMAGKVGKGDPEIEELRTKMGLGATALMQVHVGNRGGSYLLEHFEDLVNSNKMDGPTLLAGLKTEANYIHHKAMLPGDESKSVNPVVSTQPNSETPPKRPAGVPANATWNPKGNKGVGSWQIPKTQQ